MTGSSYACRPARLVVDMGSSEPAGTRRLAETVQARGVGYVDAPLCGGVVKVAVTPASYPFMLVGA
ncbi:NAD(P)-binding domain-containing protein [Amycolatopsis palatopharyngis]|uniref:NAD(P)-binding domain-containing protein n=1 Tax=Amycolatopsis palatopharyngis TaxID=187982 RepID=UPI003CCC5F43